MNILVDANILVAVLNKEYPLFPFAARVLSLHGYRQFRIFTTPISLASAFYFSEKKSGRNSAMKKVEVIAGNLSVAECLEDHVRDVIQNRKINDFEDGLQYYAALGNRCTCIVTDDLDDYYFSEIEVLKPEDFLSSYARLNKNA